MRLAKKLEGDKVHAERLLCASMFSVSVSVSWIPFQFRGGDVEWHCSIKCDNVEEALRPHLVLNFFGHQKL